MEFKDYHGMFVEDLHNYIDSLESRVKSLEADADKVAMYTAKRSQSILDYLNAGQVHMACVKLMADISALTKQEE